MTDNPRGNNNNDSSEVKSSDKSSADNDKAHSVPKKKRKNMFRLTDIVLYIGIARAIIELANAAKEGGWV